MVAIYWWFPFKRSNSTFEGSKKGNGSETLLKVKTLRDSQLLAKPCLNMFKDSQLFPSKGNKLETSKHKFQPASPLFIQTFDLNHLGVPSCWVGFKWRPRANPHDFGGSLFLRYTYPGTAKGANPSICSSPVKQNMWPVVIIVPLKPTKGKSKKKKNMCPVMLAHD